MKIESGRPSSKKKPEDIQKLKEKKISTTIYLTLEQRKKIKLYCAKNNITMKDLFGILIESLD